jgi:hypothetical protein
VTVESQAKISMLVRIRIQRLGQQQGAYHYKESFQCYVSGAARILIIFQDPDPGSIPGRLGSGSISHFNEHKEINWKYAFCLGPVGPTDKENQVNMYKIKNCFRYIAGTSLKL